MTHGNKSGAFSLLALAMFVLTGIFCSGCVMGDGCFTYHASGVLIEEKSAQPHADIKLYFSFTNEVHQEDCSWINQKAVSPDAAGRFDFSFNTGLSWSATFLFGFIPLQNFGVPPTPPPLKEVFLFAQENGHWQSMRIPLRPDQQTKTAPAERWIDLGTVSIRPGDLQPLRIQPLETMPAEVKPADARQVK